MTELLSGSSTRVDLSKSIPYWTISSAVNIASSAVLPLPHCSIIPDIHICTGLRPCCVKQQITGQLLL